MEEKKMLREIVEQYFRTGCEAMGEIRLTRVQDRKTTYVEPGVDGGRSVYMVEFKVDGKTCWAGYSSRSQTVYVSLEA